MAVVVIRTTAPVEPMSVAVAIMLLRVLQVRGCGMRDVL
jgi:hypothetical protein